MSYFLKSQIFTYIFSPLYVVKHVLVDSLTCLTSLCLYRTHVTNTFSWKNFDASVVLTGSLGGDIIDGTYEWTENIDGVFNVRKCVADRWRSEENPGNGEIPRTLAGTTELFRF